MDVVSISKFKATCLQLLERVQRTGEPILVTKCGRHIAEVVPPSAPEQPEAWLGMMRGTGKITGDILAPALEESQWEVLGS